MRKSIVLYIVPVIVLLGLSCATTPEDLQVQWNNLENNARTIGYFQAQLIYNETGSLAAIEKKAQEIAEQSAKDVNNTPVPVFKSYISTEAHGKIEGMLRFLREVKSNERKK